MNKRVGSGLGQSKPTKAAKLSRQALNEEKIRKRSRKESLDKMKAQSEMINDYRKELLDK